MKISTSLNYQRSLNNIQEAQSQVSKTREQVATGKVIVRPSEDPTKVATIENLDRAIAKTDTYSGLINDLKQQYELEETVLTSASDILIRLKELAIQAANDTLSLQDRRIIGLEVSGLKKELLNIANTQDVTGNTIFAGGNTGLQPFTTLTDGSVSYQGDARQIQVSVSDTRVLAKNRNGLDVFAPAERELVPAVAAQFTQSHGTLSQWTGQTHTLTDGTTTLSITAGGSTPTTAELVALFQADANYKDFNYTVTASGSNGFTYTAKQTGVVETANQPVLAAHANVITEGVLNAAAAVAEVSTTGNLKTAIQGGSAGDAYVVDFAGTALTFALENTGDSSDKISGSGNSSLTRASIVADIQRHSGYASGNFTVAVGASTGELVFTAKTAGIGSPATTKHASNAAVGATQTTAGTAAGVAGVDGTTQGIGFFTALEDFVVALNTNNSQNIRRAIGEIGSLHESISKAIGRVGSEIQSAETQLEMNADSNIRLQTLLSSEEDLDYSEALTRFNEEMTRLEATQASFAKVARLSLFEYL
jgi:flagellar hook-associated protein 3 FlgL